MTSETPKKYIEKLLSEVLGGMYAKSEIPVIPTVEISTPDASFGDYATNVALKLAKQAKQNPKMLGHTIAGRLVMADAEGYFDSITEAGGFINFKVSKIQLLANVTRILEIKDLYGASIHGQGKIVVIEYFQNNVAKPPHVGHLRSAVIGDSLLRIFRSQGYKAISDTHIGDWGTQFGILILAYKQYIVEGGSKVRIAEDPINALNTLYVGISQEIEKNPELRDLGKLEFSKLEKGDTDNRELWQWFVRVSLDDFERYQKLLHILPFDHNLGESFYEEYMPAVLDDFKNKGLVQIGDTGEQYVDLEVYDLGRCILVKSDGATTYHLRDFATYIYRKNQFKFEKNVYVVDNRQSHHFKQLFKVLDLAGYNASLDSVHVDLGFMSLPEGAISTRKGNIISLQNLITEGQKRALAIIEQKNPTLSQKEYVSEQVGLAAIKYFDLSHNRKTEFVFTWDSALSFEGNTGPYLQYSHARIQGILRKAKIENISTPINYENIKPEEYSILRKLLLFQETLEHITVDYFPNLLCNYLFELSQLFNSFYQEVPVMQEPDVAAKKFRIQLITATAQVINNGLYLLGIDAPEEM